MRSGENVLIVEDDEEWSDAYVRAVDDLDEHHTVSIATNLASAERLIETTRFAVAIVDVGLDINDDRNIDGLRVMERLHATADKTSIVVVTGRSGQDVLPITRDAIIEYGAYDTVAKGSVALEDITKLLDGGLKAHRKVAAAGRIAAHEALRGNAEAMNWDHRLMQATNFKGTASGFYGFLDQLFGEYLPVVAGHPVGLPDAGLPADLVCGDYWSRSIASAVAVCLAAAGQFDQAIEANSRGGKLFGRYSLGEPLKQLAGHGIKGAVFALPESRWADFAEENAEQRGQV